MMRCVPGPALWLFLPALCFSNTLYVPKDYGTIQAAIIAAATGDTVIVSPGVYLENIDFLGKAILVEAASGPAATIIDGSQADHTVVFSSKEPPDAVLAGFTVTNGSANHGGGIYCTSESSPTLEGNWIQKNMAASFGGGIYCSGSSSPVIRNTLVMENTAGALGGGLYLSYSEAELLNNVIFENSSQYGGGIRCWHSDAIMMNNTVALNTAAVKGGGMYAEHSGAAITNSIFWDNDAPENPEILAPPGTLVVTFCDVEGGHDGEGNVDEDPLFLDPANGDFHLDRYSPCINRGTDAGAPALDMDGDARPQMGTVDMGADEYKGVHTLEADAFAIPEATGGKIAFSLDAGSGFGGRFYLMLGSITGASPGTPLPGGIATIPLNWDLFTNIVIQFLNTPSFHGFTGNLDAGGTASAAFDTLGPVTGAAGATVSFAYALVEYGAWDFASNPVNIQVE